MPVATPEQAQEMLKTAREKGFAYPAVNVSSLSTANAALKGFKDAQSHGIIQLSTGAGSFASGLEVGSMPQGAISVAEHIHRVAENYDNLIFLHTDHCPPKNVDDFLIPLIEESERRISEGKTPLFNGHMVDASNLPLEENIELCLPIFKRLAKMGMILELEAGVVGGEEDGASGSEDTPDEKLYTTPEDMVEVYKQMQQVDGTYLFAATFGNVHGSYKPGAVKLQPKILRDGQEAIRKEFGEEADFMLVFHGGSSTPQAEIRETLGYGVVKMNVDTDTQYAFTRAIAEHMFVNYDKVLKVDGEVGDKKKGYDPRGYLKKAEASMAERVTRACKDLLSEGSAG